MSNWLAARMSGLWEWRWEWIFWRAWLRAERERAPRTREDCFAWAARRIALYVVSSVESVMVMECGVQGWVEIQYVRKVRGCEIQKHISCVG